MSSSTSSTTLTSSSFQDEINHPKTSGHIELIMGCMFAGKTSELMRRVKRYNVSGKHCLVIKYSKDNRYLEMTTDSTNPNDSNKDVPKLPKIATHDKNFMDAISVDQLSEVKQWELYDVIGVDEGQFFPDLVEFCDYAADQGKVVIVSALDGTFQQKPFQQIADLIPKAETVDKLSAVCMRCFKNATFTKRIGSETEIEIIGGMDKYIAVCRECLHYYDQTTQIKN